MLFFPPTHIIAKRCIICFKKYVSAAKMKIVKKQKKRKNYVKIAYSKLSQQFCGPKQVKLTIQQIDTSGWKIVHGI